MSVIVLVGVGLGVEGHWDEVGYDPQGLVGCGRIEGCEWSFTKPELC